jgi:hypothetical protein
VFIEKCWILGFCYLWRTVLFSYTRSCCFCKCNKVASFCYSSRFENKVHLYLSPYNRTYVQAMSVLVVTWLVCSYKMSPCGPGCSSNSSLLFMSQKSLFLWTSKVRHDHHWAPQKFKRNRGGRARCNKFQILFFLVLFSDYTKTRNAYSSHILCAGSFWLLYVNDVRRTDSISEFITAGKHIFCLKERIFPPMCMIYEFCSKVYMYWRVWWWFECEDVCRFM